MKSSSSASTNTSLSNKNHRQALLKTEAIYQQIQLPSISDALREIPFTNIRFLEEIGEGKVSIFNRLFDLFIENFALGEFGRIFIGELINSETKCIVKTLEKENVKNEYLREVESKRNNLNFFNGLRIHIFLYAFSFSFYSSCKYILSYWHLYTIIKYIFIIDL